MAIRVDLEGDKKLAARLRSLPHRVGRKVLRGGVVAAATVQRKAVRQRVPRVTGQLKKNVRTKTKQFTRPDKSVTFVTITGGRSVKTAQTDRFGRTFYRNPARYFHLVNNKTRPHWVFGTPLAADVGGELEYFQSSYNPGSGARYMVEKAERASRAEAQAVFVARVGRGIEREAIRGIGR